MKTFLKLAIVGVFACACSFVQAQSQDGQQTKSSAQEVQQQPQQQNPTQTAPTQTNPSATAKDYVIMQNGKLMEYSNGKMSELKNTYSASTGDKVSTAGLITMKDGTTKQMKEGDRFYKDGHFEAAQSQPQYPPKQN